MRKAGRTGTQLIGADNRYPLIFYNPSNLACICGFDNTDKVYFKYDNGSYTIDYNELINFIFKYGRTDIRKAIQ